MNMWFWGLQEPPRNLWNHPGPIEGPKEPMGTHREPSFGPGTSKEPRNFPSHKNKWLGTYMGSQPHKHVALRESWFFAKK